MASVASPTAHVDRPLHATLSALIALALGMGAAGFGYAVFGPVNDAGLIDPPLWPRPWVFWAIWMVLYPTIGLAGAELWRAPTHNLGVSLARRLFVLKFSLGLAWVPIVQASGSRVVMPVVMDIVGLIVGMVAFWAVSRVSRHAAFWLTPGLVWGVMTTILKVWRLALNGWGAF